MQRRLRGGAIDPLLSRDIKNLVGRAGRAGATTKGLVICANDAQWPAVERVAMEEPGENMVSALRGLIDRLQQYLALQNRVLTNENLEATPLLHTLIDGIDSTLVDLAAEEITEKRLVELAVALADQILPLNAPMKPRENFFVRCSGYVQPELQMYGPQAA